jgi:hypothetical protein
LVSGASLAIVISTRTTSLAVLFTGTSLITLNFTIITILNITDDHTSRIDDCQGFDLVC